MNWLLSREGRKYTYIVCMALIPLLVGYGIIDESAAPLWVALVGAIVAPSLALANLTPLASEPEDLSTVPPEA